MNYPVALRVCALSVVSLMAVACSRGPSSEDAPAAANEVTKNAPVATPAVVLKDVVEITPQYVIGISYPPSAAKYPALAAELKRYADAARTDLLEAVQARDAAAGDMLFDLSLSFTEVLDSPGMVAYAADGSSFTGGAHGAPLLARFVWLPQQQRMLTSQDLIATKAGWESVSGYVREALLTSVSQRVDADRLAPAERAEVVKSAGRMIDDGTGVDPANFAQFEPVMDPTGKVSALRFVFAPYQVGPYSDGTQTVEVPASVLLPHIAAPYRDLFVRS